jgi:hypothetical protein
MTPEETGKLLAAAATVDNRKVGPLQVLMWHRVLGDLRYEDCEAALVEHFGESTDWVMPAHIRQRVKKIRLQRLEESKIPAPPHELIDNPPAYRAWLENARRRISDGEQPAAIEANPLRSLEP